MCKDGSSDSPVLRGDDAGRDGTAYHVIPRRDDALHVQIAGEESHDAVRHDLAVFDEDAAEIAHDGRVVSDLEPGADRDLVATTGDDLSDRIGVTEIHG